MNEAVKAALANGGSVNVPDLASALGLSRNGLYLAVKRDEVKSVRIGRRIVIPAPEARRLLGVSAPLMTENAA